MLSRVIVNGAQGKMGQVACKTIEQHPEFELIAGLTRDDDLESQIKTLKPDIVIDLTRADCVFENCSIIIENHVHPVIGTSGLRDDQLKFLEDKCSQLNLGGIIVPNFSISAVLMMRFAEQAARWLNDVEIVETHHPQKYDAPSGTAIKTAELILKRQSEKIPLQKSHESIQGVRGGSYEGIPIHSLRLPGFLAKQEVIFGSLGEKLIISHESIDRICFMPGLILSCQKVKNLTKLYYGLEHLLID